MSEKIEKYVRDAVAVAWWLGPEARGRLGSEVRDHLESAVEEGLESGMGREEAEASAMRGLGRPRRGAMRLLGVSGWGHSKAVFWVVVLITVVTNTVSAAVELHSPRLRPIEEPVIPGFIWIVVFGLVVMAWYCARNMAWPVLPVCVGVAVSTVAVSAVMSPFRASVVSAGSLHVIDIGEELVDHRELGELLAVMERGVDAYQSGGLDAVNREFGREVGPPYVSWVGLNGKLRLSTDKEVTTKRWQKRITMVPKVAAAWAGGRERLAGASGPVWRRIPGLMRLTTDPAHLAGYSIPVLLASFVGWLLGQGAVVGSVLSSRRGSGGGLVK